MAIPINRRQFVNALLAGAAGVTAAARPKLTQEADSGEKLRFKYMLASCLYGYSTLEKIVPEVAKIDATTIDLWPKPHGNQREQVDAMGEDAFAALLANHKVKCGCITQYKLGPFGLQHELRVAKRLGCHIIVTGGSGPQGLSGSELKSAVRQFVERMKPHIAAAEAHGVTIAIENHGNNLIDSPDSLKWLTEFAPSRNLAIALAPYHLEQDAKLIAGLIMALGNRIAVFYAWQHGMGCMTKLPKEQELLQLPGRGPLDFAPIVNALKAIDYTGWTEVFMHPVPRGIPILPTIAEVTAEINTARRYLGSLV